MIANDPPEIIKKLDELLAEERAKSASYLRSLQAMELDVQRKEAVFEVMNNLLDGASEIVELARQSLKAYRDKFGAIRLLEAIELRDRIETFDNEDTPAYHQAIEAVTKVFQAADASARSLDDA